MSLFLIDIGREEPGRDDPVLILGRELERHGLRPVLVRDPGKMPARSEDRAGHLVPFKLSGPSFFAARRLARLMAVREAALMHVFGTEHAGLAFSAAGRAGVPVRLLSVGSASGFTGLNVPVRDVDGVIVPSDKVKSLAVRHGFPESAVFVLPPAMDLPAVGSGKPEGLLRRELSFSADEFVVGVVGHLADVRGHQALLEAAAVIKDRAPRVKLVVLGVGDLRLDDEESHVSVPDNVFYYLGFEKSFRSCLAGLDLFVMFSHLEGLGPRIVEAMAAGVPVVAADIRGLPAVLVDRETGVLVPPRDPRALAEAVSKVFFDRAFASRMAAKGREAVEREYSEEARARKLIELYARAAVRKGVRLA